MPDKELLIRCLERNRALCAKLAKHAKHKATIDANLKEEAAIATLLERARQAESPDDINEIIKILKDSDYVAPYLLDMY
jgi:hypothetical protein